MSERTMSTFNRDIDEKALEHLNKLAVKNEFARRICDDARQGKLFLAFRPKRKISFYLKGRKMCDIGADEHSEPVISAKYLPLLKSSDNNEEMMTENMWWENTGVFRYSWEEVYPEIVDNIKLVAGREGCHIAELYKFSPLVCDDCRIFLIDLEAQFSFPSDDGIGRLDLRIDTVLYNTYTKRLIFLEVKRLDDPKLHRDHEIQAEVINKLEQYKDVTINERENIIREYNKTLAAFSKLSGKMIDLIDPNSDIIVGLLITEYCSYDCKLVKKLSKEVEHISRVPVVSIGNMNCITKETLEDAWYPELQKYRPC